MGHTVRFRKMELGTPVDRVQDGSVLSHGHGEFARGTAPITRGRSNRAAASLAATALSLATWTLVVAPTSDAATGESTWTIEDLGTLGGTRSFPRDIAGDIVVGESWSSNGQEHAFAYNLAEGGPMLDLGILGAPARSGYLPASRANSADGDIVVEFSTIAHPDTVTHAFSYNLAEGGPMVDLGVLGAPTCGPVVTCTEPTSEATAVGGTVVAGWSRTTTNEYQAFVYHDGAMVDLGSLGGSEIIPLVVDGSVVVGRASAADWTDHLFSYDLAAGGPMLDRGVLPPDARVLDINANRAILTLGDWTTGDFEAAVMDLSTGDLMTLGSLPGPLTLPGHHAITFRSIEGSLLIGSSGDSAGYTQRAVVYDLASDGPLVDLGTLPGGDAVEGSMSFPMAIDGNRIVGVSTTDESVCGDLDGCSPLAAVVWTLQSPVDDPDPVPVFADVPVSQPFVVEITWLAQAGISKGWELPDGSVEYRPMAQITRDAMAAFMYRFQESQSGPITFTAPTTSPFLDVPTSQPFYREITWLAQEGISTGWPVVGGKEYRPVNQITRDAMAASMYRLAHLEYPRPLHEYISGRTRRDTAVRGELRARWRSRRGERTLGPPPCRGGGE